MTEGNYGNYNNHYQDKTICCVDCGKDFVFSSGEQAFFNSKNPPLAEPKRCKACRDYRRGTIHPPTTSEVKEPGSSYNPGNNRRGVLE